jgi:hypothetical protein
VKINASLEVTGPAPDDSFTWIITGRIGGCGYYRMPREEATRVIAALSVGTKAWWDERVEAIRPYVPKPLAEAPLPDVPVAAYDRDRDPGDENA